MGAIDSFLQSHVTPGLEPGEQIQGMGHIRQPYRFNKLLGTPEAQTEHLAVATDRRLIVLTTELGGVLTPVLKPVATPPVWEWRYHDIARVDLGVAAPPDRALGRRCRRDDARPSRAVRTVRGRVGGHREQALRHLPRRRRARRPGRVLRAVSRVAAGRGRRGPLPASAWQARVHPRGLDFYFTCPPLSAYEAERKTRIS